MDFIAALKALEPVSRLLEPTPEQRAEVRAKVTAYGEGFLNSLETSKVYESDTDLFAHLLTSDFDEQGTPVAELMELMGKAVDQTGLNAASGGHLGYIPGGGQYYAALGDYLAAVTNNYAGVFFASPGAVRMENRLMDWMARLVGYPKGYGGNLASGGSLANLMAIVSARDAHQLKAKDFDRAVVYGSQQMHHCLDKALRIAGLGECVKRHIPLDDHFRMQPEALQAAIAEDRAAGRLPWLVIASAGTTDTGAVDLLQSLGTIAQQEKLWFHVDGAYGAFFLLTDHGREKLQGIELSDSVVMDPHKGLFLPYGLGVVLVKERAHLQQSHYYQASYLQDTINSIEEPSPADLSPELTKHFRGLRLWLPLKLLGLRPFKAALEEKLLLARYFREQLLQRSGFEVGPEPELSVVIYRYVPAQGDANAFNEALVKAIHEDGRVFISSTTINGKFTLRLAVLSFRTHLATIDLLLQVLQEKIALLESGTSNGS